MFIKVNNINLFYEVKGEGQPLIMVHGNSEDHSIFLEASEVLKEYYKVYLIDSRSHGQSEKVKELHYDDMANDVVAFIEELDLKDVVYFGFSDGGIIGLLTALKTDRISRLFPCGANLTPNGMSTKIKILIKLFYFFSRNDKMKLMLNEPNIKPESLKAINIPVTVIVGENDLVSSEETQQIVDNIPNAKLRKVSGGGHTSYVVHKTVIADIILEESCKREE